MQLVNIGFGNIVSAERIVAIVSPESAPIKRIVQEAKENQYVLLYHIFHRQLNC